MGAAVGGALLKAPVTDSIVSFLDDWSSAATCAADSNDIANITDAEIALTNRRIDLYSARVFDDILYMESLDYPYRTCMNMR